MHISSKFKCQLSFYLILIKLTFSQTGKGILRSMRGDSLSVCDLVPVDFAVNMMISVGWYIAQFQPKTVLIFHSTIGNVNPFTWGEIGKLLTVNIVSRTQYYWER